MKYRLIEQWQQEAQSVQQACRVLAVSRAGYYRYRKRLGRPLAHAASRVHLQAAFEASGRSYGSRRLRVALQKRGIPLGRHRVRRLMREAGIRPVWRRKFIATTDSH